MLQSALPLLPLALVAALAAAPTATVAPRVGPPTGVPPPSQQGGGGQAREMAARDLRTGFDNASAQAARIELQGLRPGDPRRAVAFVTLGAARAISERAMLITAASEGLVDERVAALLALGELGPGIGDGLSLLERFASAETGQLQAACLVALARCQEPSARVSLARLAGSEGVVAAQAKAVMAHAIDPNTTNPPALWRTLYELRWAAARRFGTVDGRPWRLVRSDELAADLKFLEGLIYLCTPELKNSAARDQLLELLMTPGAAVARIDAMVRMMPLELERLIDSGVWRPGTRFEWIRLVDAIVLREDWRRFPSSLALAAVTPEVRPMVAGLLHRVGGPFEEALLEAFGSDDFRARANAAYAAGAASLNDYSTTLRDLAHDPEPWVRANALVARVRMGEAAAIKEVEALLATPPERRPDRMTAFVFELFERAAPDSDILELLERLEPSLAELDRLHANAILILNGRRADTQRLREALPTLDGTSPETFRVIRALGSVPTAEALDALAASFPFDDSNIANLFAAAALVNGRHRAVDPLLAAAIWNLDLNLSTLAAGLVYETRGGQMLRQWVVRPPATAREEDLRRVGYVLGEWGGPREVDALRADLGTASGGEEAALQGALLGMLSARTR